MVNPSYRETALHYCVDDLPGTNIRGSRLHNIIEGLRLGKPVTRLSSKFLKQQGLEALHRLTTGALNYDRVILE